MQDSMIFGLYLNTEKGKGNLDRARNILMNEFGLVPPKYDSWKPTEKDVIVWEDDQGIGRYRVHFHPNSKTRDGNFYDKMRFSYWLNKEKAKREIFEQDPMSPALYKVMESIKGIFHEERVIETSIDEIMEDIFGKNKSNYF